MKSALLIAVALGATGCPGKKAEGVVKNNEDPGVGKVIGEQAKPEVPKVLTAAELVERYKACQGYISAGKWDELKSQCLDGSYRNHPIAGTPELKGPEPLIAYFKDVRTAFPDWTQEPELVLVSGRNIFSVVRTGGTNTGVMKTPGGELPATSKKVSQLMFDRVEINDANKVSDEWAIVDAVTTLGQLGMGPASRPLVEAAPLVVVIGADDAKEKANLEIVKKANAAFDAHKPAEIAALFADTGVISDRAEPGDTTGKAAIAQSLTVFFGVFPDAKLANIEMWAAGDYVVQIGKFEGTHSKDLGTLKRTGKRVAVEFAEIVKIADGKIVERWRFSNALQLGMQLGVAPALPAPAKK
jgi:predicted ester cyclase